MDPNDMLAELRQRFIDCGLAARADDAGQFGRMFQALDEWLSKGGALPHAWAQAAQVIDARIEREEMRHELAIEKQRKEEPMRDRAR